MKNIRRPEKFEGIFKLLSERPHPSTGKPIFSTLRDLLCFVAVIGFNEGKRTPLEGKTIELDGRVFDNSQSSMDLIYLLALAEGRDAMILHPDREDEVATIFEEFSATGLGVLDRWMKECSDDINGDRAILTALRKEGFLKKSSGPSVNNVIDQVQF